MEINEIHMEIHENWLKISVTSIKIKTKMKTIKINENQWNRQLAGPRPKAEGLVLRRAMRQRTPGRRSAAEKYIIRCQIKQTDEKMIPEK